MRSADSWMGVSGFLISWATRRATSPQAWARWAETISEMSSKTSRRCASGSSARSEEHTSELQSPCNLVCRLLLEKKKKKSDMNLPHKGTGALGWHNAVNTQLWFYSHV